MAQRNVSGALLDELRQLHPLLIDLSLERIERLLSVLGDPHLRLPPVIHVAGTNGKGSTCTFVKTMLEAAGLRVHVYTSPHLVSFNERISLAGPDGRSQPIGETALVDVLTRVRDANAGEPITFFEITTAAAFLAFAEHPADAIVLEVGLGGRLDTTNVIPRPALSVITPVAMDHAEKLGDTLAKIAAEKAGIIKRGRPCIVGPQEPEAADVIGATARRLGAPVLAWGADFDAYVQNGRLVFQEGEALLDLPLPALRGPHQIVNAGVAVAAARALRLQQGPFAALDEPAIAEGLQTASWPARMTPLNGGPLSALLGAGDELWLDGGHNPAAGKVIAQTLADIEERAPKPTWLVCGMMGQKDIAGFLASFRGLVRGVVTVPVAGGIGEPTPAERVAEIASAIGLDAVPATDVRAALRHLDRTEASPKRVLICGSLYLAGTVLAIERGISADPN